MTSCFSCGNQVDDSARFCTACGKPIGLVSAQRIPHVVCPSCGASADPSSSFCTICGKPLQPAKTPTPGVSILPQSMVESHARGAHCTSCGSSLDPGAAFCTFCGQPAAGASSAPAPSTSTASPSVAASPNATVSVSTPLTVASSVSAAPAPETATVQESVPVPQPATPAYSAASGYTPASQSGGGFRMVILILVVLVLGGALGGWYFWGVETIVVCNPPDVTVFLDDKEITPTSYGRYVVPHLSRKPHLLKIQSPGFADTLQRLDFPLTSSREWVNIRLVPSQQR